MGQDEIIQQVTPGPLQCFRVRWHKAGREGWYGARRGPREMVYQKPSWKVIPQGENDQQTLIPVGYMFLIIVSVPLSNSTRYKAYLPLLNI